METVTSSHGPYLSNYRIIRKYLCCIYDSKQLLNYVVFYLVFLMLLRWQCCVFL